MFRIVFSLPTKAVIKTFKLDTVQILDDLQIFILLNTYLGVFVNYVPEVY